MRRRPSAHVARLRHGRRPCHLASWRQRLARAHRPHPHAGRTAAGAAEAARRPAGIATGAAAASRRREPDRTRRSTPAPAASARLNRRVEVRVEEPLPFRSCRTGSFMSVALRSTWMRPFTRPIFGGSSGLLRQLAAIRRLPAEAARHEQHDSTGPRGPGRAAAPALRASRRSRRRECGRAASRTRTPGARRDDFLRPRTQPVRIVERPFDVARAAGRGRCPARSRRS